MDGVDVAVNDLPSQQDGLEQLVKEIEKIGRKAMFVTGDVSKESDVQELVKKTVDVLGGLDIVSFFSLVNEVHESHQAHA